MRLVKILKKKKRKRKINAPRCYYVYDATKNDGGQETHGKRLFEKNGLPRARRFVCVYVDALAAGRLNAPGPESEGVPVAAVHGRASRCAAQQPTAAAAAEKAPRGDCVPYGVMRACNGSDWKIKSVAKLEI